jgi:hypothetical protein
MRDLAICLLGGLIGLGLSMLILATELDRNWLLVPRAVVHHGRG